MFSLRRGPMQMCPLTTSIQQCTRGPSQCHRPEKIKGNQTGEEEAYLFYKVSLFADMYMYSKNHRIYKSC